MFSQVGLSLPVNMTDHGWEGVQEKRGDLVQGVEDERISPDDDSEADRT